MKLSYRNLLKIFFICIFTLLCIGLTLTNYLVTPDFGEDIHIILFWTCFFISPTLTFLTSILMYYLLDVEFTLLANLFFVQLGENTFRLNWLSLLTIFITGYYTWFKKALRWLALPLIIIILLYGCILPVLFRPQWGD